MARTVGLTDKVIAERKKAADEKPKTGRNTAEVAKKAADEKPKTGRNTAEVAKKAAAEK